MKLLLTFIVFLLIVENIFSQNFTDQNQIKDFYLEKSKNQNTTGWVLLGAGTALIIGGAYAFDKSWDNESATVTDISGFAILAGVIADIACIPFFISAGRNKKKAASLSLCYQNIYVKQNFFYCQNGKPSIVLKVEF